MPQNKDFFHRLCAKSLFIFAFICVFCISASAYDLFPVEYTDETGQTLWGYMNDDGALVIDYTYQSAQVFDTAGFAAVTNTQGQTALLLSSGELCTDWLDDIITVEYESTTAALRTETSTSYYTNAGRLIGTFENAVGFPHSSRVGALMPVTIEPETTETDADSALLEPLEAEVVWLYGYYNLDQEIAIEPIYIQIGDFNSGRALAQTEDGIYHQIDSSGESVATLPNGAVPVSLTISDQDLVILQGGNGYYAVYSIANQSFLTSYVYEDILPFSNGYAQVQQNGVWGLLSEQGEHTIEPTYPYMHDMGEGMYAVYGTNGGVSCVNATGTVIYQTDAYVGGFDSFRYNLTWHGTLEGNLVVYNAAGTLQRTFDAELASIVSPSVVRLDNDGVISYVDIFTEEVLQTITRSYALENGMQIDSRTYFKWLGMHDDGSDYGWTIEYPIFSGLEDETLLQTINDTVRTFFLQGPTSVESNAPLTATYGFSIEGNVLVVWAQGVINASTANVLWNDSIGIDLQTGASYAVIPDLLKDNYFTVLKSLLPQGMNFGYPRMQQDGIMWYCNYTSQTGMPYAESYFLSYEELYAALNYHSACYIALTDNEIPQYTDVPTTHWGYAAISNVTFQGYMNGVLVDDEEPVQAYFYPDTAVQQRDVFVAFARLLGYEQVPDPIQPTTQQPYADSMASLYEAGLLESFTVDPSQTITRLELMVFLSNALQLDSQITLPDAEQTALLLEPYQASLAQTTQSEQQAIALCLQQGIIQGTGTTLALSSTVTRAALAQICMMW